MMTVTMQPTAIIPPTVPPTIVPVADFPETPIAVIPVVAELKVEVADGDDGEMVEQ